MNTCDCCDLIFETIEELYKHQTSIIQDLNFELEKIIIDGTDLKHLIWQSKYVPRTL